MEERARRIIDTAIDLAEKGGFEAVRLRDVASHAGVALGTVYKRFRSKEDILVAALEREFVAVQDVVSEVPIEGVNRSERAGNFFALATRHLCSRPKLARAVIKAMASGNAEATQKVASFQVRLTGMLGEVICGGDMGDVNGHPSF